MTSDEWGLAPTHKEILDAANNILRADGVSEDRLISEKSNWVNGLIQRHSEKLANVTARALATERASAANPETIARWFRTAGPEVDGVESGNIYAMDETGTQMGTQATRKVVGKKGKKMHYHTCGGDKETITAIVTICADGTTEVRPVLIYKGKNMMVRWTNNNIAKAACVFLSSGYRLY
jgi:hypothetical protein